MSNDSRTGTFEASMTVNTWKRYYQQKGGMPTLLFRVR